MWCFAGIYCLIFILTGFVRWDAPNVYVVAFVVVCGLTVNVLLLRRAKNLSRFPMIALMLVSLLLTTIIAGIFAFMAIGP